MGVWAGMIHLSSPYTIRQATTSKRCRGRYNYNYSFGLPQTFCRNKEKWKREITLNGPGILSNGLHGVSYGLPEQSSILLGSITLKEALARPAPVEFKVLARAMDFFPFSLEDACVLRCAKCETR